MGRTPRTFLTAKTPRGTNSSMLRPFIALLALANAAFAATDTEKLLARSIIDSNLPLAEVQAFTEARVPLMPKVSSAAEWTRIADVLRKDTLDKVVFRGE